MKKISIIVGFLCLTARGANLKAFEEQAAQKIKKISGDAGKARYVPRVRLAGNVKTSLAEEYRQFLPEAVSLSQVLGIKPPRRDTNLSDREMLDEMIIFRTRSFEALQQLFAAGTAPSLDKAGWYSGRMIENVNGFRSLTIKSALLAVEAVGQKERAPRRPAFRTGVFAQYFKEPGFYDSLDAPKTEEVYKDLSHFTRMSRIADKVSLVLRYDDGRGGNGIFELRRSGDNFVVRSTSESGCGHSGYCLDRTTLTYSIFFKKVEPVRP